MNRSRDNEPNTMPAFTFAFSHSDNSPAYDDGEESVFEVTAHVELHREHCPGSFLDGDYADTDIESIKQVSGPELLIFTDDKIYRQIEKEAEAAAWAMV